jgi:hypothetical protein
VLRGDQGLLQPEDGFWGGATGREILTLARLTLDTQVAFSPDGRRLAAASSAGELALWKAASKAEVAAREARERPPAGPAPG